MPFCGNCGANVTEGTAFCSSCGAPVSRAAAPSGAGPAAAGMAPNVAAVLTYVLGFITGIIFLVLEPYKNDRFVRFHAFQSIGFNVAVIVFWIVWGVVSGILAFGPLGFMWTILSLLWMIIWLGMILYWLFLMYKAYNNERYMIPVIGEFAAKQAG